MTDHPFDERIAHLHIVYDPDDPAAEDFGPIRVSLPGSVVNMGPREALEASKAFADVAWHAMYEEQKERELIEVDFDGLSDSEIMVLLLMDDDGAISMSRLQRLALLYRELYEVKE